MSSSPVAIPNNAKKTTSMPTERASPGKVATSPKKTRKIGTSRAPPNASDRRPATSIAALPAMLVAGRRPRRRAAPVRAARRSRRWRAGLPGGRQPTRPRTIRRRRRPRRDREPASELQVPLHEVLFLKPPQAFTDLTRTHGPDAADRLEIALRRADDRVEIAETAHDLFDDAFGQARNARQDPEASRGH